MIQGDAQREVGIMVFGGDDRLKPVLRGFIYEVLECRLHISFAGYAPQEA